jgi:hypothetical protein
MAFGGMRWGALGLVKPCNTYSIKSGILLHRQAILYQLLVATTKRIRKKSVADRVVDAP